MAKKIQKEWYKSKTIHAALASLVIAVLSAMFGETDVAVTVAISLASALGIYGRVVAASEIKS